jgi:hypothetical protein
MIFFLQVYYVFPVEKKIVMKSRGTQMIIDHLYFYECPTNLLQLLLYQNLVLIKQT